ncbi:MAG: cation transporter [Xanthomonadaceae bacterium]|jgi:copper chaperone|nr:cation transporter [Xanthomonadaceae bacterium]
MQHVELNVEGMTCNGCVARLKKALDAADGVRDAQVGLEGPQVRLDYDPAVIDLAAIKETIEDTGFDVV